MKVCVVISNCLQRVDHQAPLFMEFFQARILDQICHVWVCFGLHFLNFILKLNTCTGSQRDDREYAVF